MQGSSLQLGHRLGLKAEFFTQSILGYFARITFSFLEHAYDVKSASTQAA